MNKILLLSLVFLCAPAFTAHADKPSLLFDGKSMDKWDFAEGSWVIEDDGSMACVIQSSKKRQKGRGYIWTKKDYKNFELSLSYKLSEACNSGVFYRSKPEDPVQGGFEIQLLDNAGFQKVKGKKDAKNLNGAFYDCQPAKVDPANPVGEWNTLKLIANGPKLQVQINGKICNQCNIDDWDTANKNPDGSKNKFKTALKDLPRSGRIGFQNHGQVVWFKDITIKELP